MPLISLWKSNPEAVSQLNIEQVVSAAGDGNLKDASACSQELQTFLTEIPTKALAAFIEHCLTNSYKQSGQVLQDLVNEVGRRLDYVVTNGRYQGIPSAVGYDGIWRSPDSNDLVVEVKTTDAYRISLDTIAGYRGRLITAGEIGDSSSILMVVGRDDTGELEAQIRGSRHAWDVRLISIEALLKVLQVKENSNESETGTKIRSLFNPVEYTRLDRLVDVVFTAATDVEAIPPSPDTFEGVQAQVAKSEPKGSYEFTDSALLQEKRISIIETLAQRRAPTSFRKAVHNTGMLIETCEQYAQFPSATSERIRIPIGTHIIPSGMSFWRRVSKHSSC